MLIAIVLDRPLKEAQDLVDQPLQFLQEIKRVLDPTTKIQTSPTKLGTSAQKTRSGPVFKKCPQIDGCFMRNESLWLHLVIIIGQWQRCKKRPTNHTP